MINSLVSKLDANPEKAAITAARLAKDHETARERLELASEAWSNALADEAEGAGDPTVTAKTEKELDAARKAEAASRAALTAAQGRHKAALAQEAREHTARAWAKAEALSGARNKQAAKLAKSAEAFAADYLALLKANNDLHSALPAKPDMDAALLRQGQMEMAVRQHLRACGVDWAFNAVFGVVALPAFLPKFEEAAQVVSQWKAAATASPQR